MKEVKEEVVKLTLGTYEYHEDPKAVKIEMWYDRHRREWVLYPVDEEGNQIAPASYGFSKAEAKEIKKDLEAEYL